MLDVGHRDENTCKLQPEYRRTDNEGHDHRIRGLRYRQIERQMDRRRLPWESAIRLHRSAFARSCR